MISGAGGGIGGKIYKWKRYELNSSTTYTWNKWNLNTTTTYKWNKYSVNETLGETSQSVDPTSSSNRQITTSQASDPTCNYTSGRPAIITVDGIPCYRTSQSYAYIYMGSYKKVGSVKEGYCTQKDSSSFMSNGSYFYKQWVQLDHFQLYNSPQWYAYFRTVYTATMVKSKGDTSYGQVTSTNSSAYPANGASGSYWYESAGSSTSYSKGSYVGTVSSGSSSSYPNGGASGSYWYDNRTSSISYSQGSYVDEIFAVDSAKYPQNGRSGSYWYVYDGEAN